MATYGLKDLQDRVVQAPVETNRGGLALVDSVDLSLLRNRNHAQRASGLAAAGPRATEPSPKSAGGLAAADGWLKMRR